MQDVTNGPSMLARQKGISVRQTELPKELSRVGLPAGLDAEELAELLVDSIRTMRPSGDGPDIEALKV